MWRYGMLVRRGGEVPFAACRGQGGDTEWDMSKLKQPLIISSCTQLQIVAAQGHMDLQEDAGRCPPGDFEANLSQGCTVPHSCSIVTGDT